MAGGTGSGLGSFAMGVLRDLYPNTPIFACCVLPFREGEVAVQSYNACLSLHAAYEHADLIFPFENHRKGILTEKASSTNHGAGAGGMASLK